MKILIVLLLTVLFLSCNEDINPIDPDSTVTAKESIDAVKSAAKNSYAADAELAAIYGRNISTTGEVDLLNTNSLNIFVYIMQSDAQSGNEFYVPVYLAGPIKSPINFSTMLSFIKDTTAQSTVGTALGYLSTVHITAEASFQDSPSVLNTLFGRNDVIQFRNSNPNSLIDMFLFPGKAIDPQNGLINSADWVVNFYGDTASLVLWLNSNTGIVTVLSN